jgi:phosphotriesterase-related protein
VQAEGVDPAALVVVHADGIADAEARARLARAGAWVEYDGVRAGEAEKHVRLVKDMVERGLAGRLLLSHDAGWYAAGEAGGAKEKIRPFTAITDELLPALRKAGLEEALLEKLLVENPRQAFTIRVRKAR